MPGKSPYRVKSPCRVKVTGDRAATGGHGRPRAATGGDGRRRAATGGDGRPDFGHHPVTGYSWLTGPVKILPGPLRFECPVYPLHLPIRSPWRHPLRIHPPSKHYPQLGQHCNISQGEGSPKYNLFFALLRFQFGDFVLHPRTMKPCPSRRSRQQLQNSGIETSVRPTPTGLSNLTGCLTG